MGRKRIGIAVAGVIVTLLGVVAAVTMRSDGGVKHTDTVASAASGDRTAPVVPPTVVPAVPGTVLTAPARQGTPAAPAAKAPSAPPTTKAPAKAPATATPTSIPAQPSVQDVQQIIAGVTAQVMASAVNNNGSAPLTGEQIEAQIRAQLKLLGINI